MTLPIPVRRSLRGGLVATAVLTLAACGGGLADDAPSDADPTEFCDTFFSTDKTASEVAAELAELGTPEGITDEQRHGFEIYVDGLDDEGDTPKADVKVVQIPADDKDDGNAFVDYAVESCSAIAPADPSTEPTDPTSEPTTDSTDPTSEPTTDPTSEPTTEPTATES